MLNTIYGTPQDVLVSDADTMYNNIDKNQATEAIKSTMDEMSTKLDFPANYLLAVM